MKHNLNFRNIRNRKKKLNNKRIFETTEAYISRKGYIEECPAATAPLSLTWPVFPRGKPIPGQGISNLQLPKHGGF